MTVIYGLAGECERPFTFGRWLTASERGHYLHNTCRSKKADQEVIVDMVINGLHGQLMSLPEEWIVLLPAAWLSSLLEVR
jgi:hypothetical protein